MVAEVLLRENGLKIYQENPMMLTQDNRGNKL